MIVSTSIAAFFAGAFLANAVPHFVHGISGDRFPTPFAKPPGKGLSSPTVNAAWALVNIAIGGVLFRHGGLAADDIGSWSLFFAGMAAISLPLSWHFAKKDLG